MQNHRVPINSLEAVLAAYVLGVVTAVAFTAYGKFVERTVRNEK